VQTTVRLSRRRSLEVTAEIDAVVSRNLLGMTTRNLQHAENHMLLLGRKTSLERVAAFLLEMDGRLSNAEIMSLPMSCRDIADYLGLTLETVSRALIPTVLPDTKSTSAVAIAGSGVLKDERFSS
jgi:CRP/FNR family nitrogen fixation transcriptional regulator